MNQIDKAIDALIPIPSMDELQAADEQKLLRALEWVGRWYRELDAELKARAVVNIR
jgi:hypothetical protein